MHCSGITAINPKKFIYLPEELVPMKKIITTTLILLSVIFLILAAQAQTLQNSDLRADTSSGKAGIRTKQPSSIPEVIECPPGSILSAPSTNFSNAYTSSADPAAGYIAATPYNVNQPIGGLLRFWGLRMYFNGGWAECFEDPLEFEITFWDDNAGEPGNIQQSFIASVSPTDIGENFAGYPLWQWDVIIPFAVNLQNGWMSIQSTANNSNCWFLWVDAPDYAGTFGAGLQWNSGIWGPLTEPFPLGHCFSQSGPQLNNDVGIHAINAPTTGVNLGMEPIIVTILNYGTDPQSDIPVFYSIDGGTPVNEVFAGPLAGGANAQYTFTQQYDFSAYGTYDIQACTNLPGDENPANDCTTKTIENQQPALCQPVYTTGCNYGDGLTYFDIDGQINNYSGCDNNTGYPGWSQYLDMWVILQPGMTYVCTAETGYSDQYYSVWIDGNDDLVFSENEKIIDCAHIPSAGVPVNEYFTVPAGISPCQHVLRVRAEWLLSCPHNPCESMAYGEAEDYTVFIPTACIGTLEGYVYQAGTTIPIEGAIVKIGTETGTSDINGYYQITGLYCCTFSVTATHPAYCSQTVPGITIPSGSTVTQNFELPRADISTEPDPAVGFDVVLDENQTFTTAIGISNYGNCDLEYDIALTGLTEAFGGQCGGEVIATGKEVPLDEFTRMNTGIPTQIDKDMPFEVNPNPTTPNPSEGEEIFGSDQNSYTAGPRTRGNFFEVTTATQLAEHKLWLNVPTATQMWFVVYESPTLSGTYTLISAANVSPQGPGGPGWFSSGPLSNVTLQAGYYYLICASFEQSCSYFNEQGISPYPIPASFGALVSGAGWDWAPTSNFPPDQTQTVPTLAGAPVAYYQSIVTGLPVDWFWLDYYSGSVLPGDSVSIPAHFNAAGYAPGTVKTAEMKIVSNSGPDSVLTIPVTMTISGGKELDLKVFLEGAWDSLTGMMDTALNANGLIPLGQPFNPVLPYYGNPMPAWYYTGSESVSAIGNDVVDWLLAEIRDAATVQDATPAATILEIPLFLLYDGTIVSLDMVNKPVIPVTISEGMFVVVHHRNHLSIIRAVPIPLSGNTYIFDFTAGGIWGGQIGAKEVGPGIWAMTGGDGNADYQINTQDKIDAWWPDAGSSGYLGSDFDMNGEVGNQDKIDIWAPNSGQSSQVPD